MIFEICASIATLIFAILTFFIVRTLKEIQNSCKAAGSTLANFEAEAALIKIDAEKLIASSNQLIEKINNKITDLDPLFHSVSSIGTTVDAAVNRLTNSIENHDFHFFKREEKKSNWEEKVLDVIELTGLGIKIFQQMKRRK